MNRDHLDGSRQMSTGAWFFWIALLVIVPLWLFWKSGRLSKDAENISAQKSQVEIPLVKFTDVTAQSGIRFVHANGAAGEKLLPETMGGGVAFFDFDNDGDEDLLFINSTQWPWNRVAGAMPKL